MTEEWKEVVPAPAGSVPTPYKSFKDALGRKWLTATAGNWWQILALVVGLLIGWVVGHRMGIEDECRALAESGVGSCSP